MGKFDLEETLPDGSLRYKVLKNGATYDRSKGQIVGPPTTSLITKENAHAMHDRRRQLVAERTRAGIAAGLGMDLTRASGGEEWQELTRLFVDQFRKSSNLRGMAESYEKIGRAAGYLTPGEEDTNATAQVVNALLRLFDRMERGNAIDAEVLE